MRRKARIDLLEVEEKEAQELAEKERAEEEAPSLPKSTFLRRTFHWKFFLFVVLPVISLLLVIGGVTYLFLGKKEPRVAQKEKSPVVSPTPALVELNHLSTVVPDAKGQDRVILFSLVLVPAPGKEALFSGEEIEMRAAIVRIVSESIFPDVLSASSREEVKRKVQEYLEKEKGAGSVHAVFITSWRVI
ncbi:MAG TPA: hypothetical protein PLT64_09330 [Syntrophales bacterium]|nr:hypothetical protein [Syntrophales bacterium]HOL60044.1 hypothetical protein [Syntrophales bacterium]